MSTTWASAPAVTASTDGYRCVRRQTVKPTCPIRVPSVTVHGSVSGIRESFKFIAIGLISMFLTFL